MGIISTLYKRKLEMSKETYTYTPYIQLKEASFTIPDIVFIGYDKDGNAKFKKTKKDE